MSLNIEEIVNEGFSVDSNGKITDDASYETKLKYGVFLVNHFKLSCRKASMLCDICRKKLKR
jgi:hypothetical protein